MSATVPISLITNSYSGNAANMYIYHCTEDYKVSSVTFRHYSATYSDEIADYTYSYPYWTITLKVDCLVNGKKMKQGESISFEYTQISHYAILAL